MDPKRERLNNLQSQLDSLQCDHPKTIIRKKGPHYGRQCTRCGSSVGQWIPHDQVLQKDKIEPFDESLQDKYQCTVREQSKALLARMRDLKKQDWDAWYAEYLNSPEWRSKKLKVLTRCGYVCEGCGSNKATLVHHLAYTNVGNEFLFELIGLCKQCHDSIHEVTTDGLF